VPRDIVLWLDQAAPRERLPDVWQGLVGGAWRVADSFCDPNRCYLVLRCLPTPRKPISRRQAELLRRWLRGHSQKAMALEFELAPSTVAISLGRAVRALGLSCRPQNVPLALVLLGQLDVTGLCRLTPRLSRYETPEARYEVLSLARPDAVLPAGLSTAEAAVARLIVEGATSPDACRMRGTVPRTIKNQLAAVARKTSTSGRYELVQALLAQYPKALKPPKVA
jgi:DNA-binding CsgD family transcriptional regulator